MVGPIGQSLVVCAIFLVGLATGHAARWLDCRLDVLLDRGVWAAIATTACPDPSPSGSPAFEIGVILLLGLVAASAETWERMGGAMGLSAALIVCAWIDWRNHILPDVVVLPLLAIGLLLATACQLFVDVSQALCGLFLGVSMALLVRVLGRGMHGCLGAGDIKLIAALGAWLGPIAVTIIFLASSSFMVVALIFRRKDDGESARPFGPAMAAAAIIYLLCFPMFPVSWPSHEFTFVSG
jgi:prepilin signal peptidase PulO-like enzyme (type II secretory pathway)